MKYVNPHHDNFKLSSHRERKFNYQDFIRSQTEDQWHISMLEFLDKGGLCIMCLNQERRLFNWQWAIGISVHTQSSIHKHTRYIQILDFTRNGYTHCCLSKERFRKHPMLDQFSINLSLILSFYYAKISNSLFKTIVQIIK